MPFIEIITDSKSQAQLNKVITKSMVNNCDILYIKDKNIEIENGYLDYVSFEIDRDIKIDGKEVNYTDEKGQFAYKESDNKVKVYDLINIKNKKNC